MRDSPEEVFQVLRRTVYESPELQEHLFALGDANDFVSAVCELARSLGFSLEHETVLQAMRNEQRSWHNRKSL